MPLSDTSNLLCQYWTLPILLYNYQTLPICYAIIGHFQFVMSLSDAPNLLYHYRTLNIIVVLIYNLEN